MFFHSGQAFLIFIEIRQMLPDTLHHRFCIQMLPHDGVSITNFRQTSAISCKYSLSKLHSFHHRESKTFSFTRKQERLTVPIQPYLFTLSDYICQKHISDLLLTNQITHFFSISEMGISTNIQIIFREMAHYVNQEMEILFPTDLSNRKKERTSRRKRRLGSFQHIDPLHPIIDDPDLFPLQIYMLANDICYIMRNRCDY